MAAVGQARCRGKGQGRGQRYVLRESHIAVPNIGVKSAKETDAYADRLPGDRLPSFG